jgi:hypothetical protein
LVTIQTNSVYKGRISDYPRDECFLVRGKLPAEYFDSSKEDAP